MKYNKKAILGGFIVSLAMFIGAGALPVFAQEGSEDVVEDVGAIILADISIHEAEITAQIEDVFDISFDLANGEGVQTQIKYIIQLTRTRGDGRQSLVHEKVYDEEVSISENSSLSKNIQYTAPAYLGGDYQMWIVAQNKSGVRLGLADLGDITLSGSAEYIEIVLGSCYLEVVGEGVQYTIEQGVDIEASESLVAYCKIKNNFDIEMSIAPLFETRYRSSTGDIVSTDTPDNPSIVFAPSEKKTISIALPKASAPQAYDVQLNFGLSGSTESISNTVIFHYVLRGSSATIQNVSLDKDYYKEGDTANISLSWSLAADSFSGSRFAAGTGIGNIFLDLDIVDSTGVSCISAIQGQKLSKKEAALSLVQVPLVRDCLDPKIVTSLIDKEGVYLDQKEFAVTSVNIPEGGFSQKTLIVSAVVVGVIVLIGLLLMWLRRKNMVPVETMIKSFFFVLLVGSAFMIPAGDVEAVTFSVREATFTTGINKTSFNPGESIRVTGSISVSVCTNAANVGSVSLTANGTTVVSGSGNYINRNSSITLTAPTTPGNYTMSFYGRVSQGGAYGGARSNYGGAVSIAYTVIKPPTPPTITITASPQNVVFANPTDITWSTTNATSCTASGGWSGTKATSGTQSTGNLIETTNFSLTCTGPDGTIAKNLTVNVGAIPPTITFTANPILVDYAGSTELDWTITDADYCLPDGWQGPVTLTSGSKTMPNITSEQTYVISCWGPLEEIVTYAGITILNTTYGKESYWIRGTSQTSVIVAPPPPPLISFRAKDNPVDYGTPATLIWSGEYTGTSCEASESWTGTKTISEIPREEITGDITEDKEYILTCIGDGGTTVKTFTLDVTLPPVILVSPSPLIFGKVLLGKTNAIEVSIDNDGEGTLEGAISVNPPFYCDSGCNYSITNEFGTTARILFSPKGGDDGLIERILNFTGNAPTTIDISGIAFIPVPPTLTFTAVEENIVSGDKTTLVWSTTDAISCIGSEGWNGEKGPGGTEDTANLVSSTLYTLSCEGPGGNIVRSVTVFPFICGNGICEEGETLSSCTADCRVIYQEF